jgi:proteasome lid subunit RPN8/RPN11
MAWKELEPDFKKYAPNILLERLPFDQSINLISMIGKDITVILKESASKKAFEYVSSIKVESGGLLIGKVFELNDEIKPIVLIEDCVPSSESKGTSVSLKMDSSVWAAANKMINSDQFVVGWFHSHPNLGAFFSGTDRGTQKSFFREDYHLGWVIDPIRLEEAWFSGQDSLDIKENSILRTNYV